MNKSKMVRVSFFMGFCLSSISAVWHSHRSRGEKFLRQHHAIFFEDGAVLHHKLHMTQRGNIRKRVADDGNEISKETRFDWSAFFDDVGRFITIDGDGAQDIGSRNTRRLPGIQKSD